MNRLGQLASSVSVLALASSGAFAYSVAPETPGGRTQEQIAQQPGQKDINAPRVFTIFLRDSVSGSADLVANYFRDFGFVAQYYAATNSIELHGSYVQAKRAGNFSCVPGSRRTGRPVPNPGGSTALRRRFRCRGSVAEAGDHVLRKAVEVSS
jgi:hypothetical protein